MPKTVQVGMGERQEQQIAKNLLKSTGRLKEKKRDYKEELFAKIDGHDWKLVEELIEIGRKDPEVLKILRPQPASYTWKRPTLAHSIAAQTPEGIGIKLKSIPGIWNLKEFPNQPAGPGNRTVELAFINAHRMPPS